MVGEQGHVEVDAVAPDAGHLDGDGGDETQRARAVGEGADGPRAAFDLAVQALEAVRRADARAVCLGEGEVRGRVVEAALETLDRLGELLEERKPSPRPVLTIA